VRIALIAPVWFSVPPRRYGGIERVVSLLAEGLVAHGHDVTVFASGDSTSAGRLAWLYEVSPSDQIGQMLPELEHALFSLLRARDFDIVNDHTSPLGAALGGLIDAPFLHTVHGPVGGREGDVYENVRALSPAVRLISISYSQRRGRPDLPWLANCYNALDRQQWPFSADERNAAKGSFLLFLGRMGDEKGAGRAIEVARAARAPLKIAAKCVEPDEVRYFEASVKPHLGGDIEWLGEVGDEEKRALLREARALLHPIQWDEPFGLVMIEAMACGTPVVAIRRGSVPEVVLDGVSGIVVDDHREMPDALVAADRLDPRAIRRVVEERFTVERLVESYLQAYRALLGREDGLAAPASSP
jgi:glycosyltransferase involved in cell wall biosynthesis